MGKINSRRQTKIQVGFRMKKKWLRCSDCGSAFDTLKNLNSHIVKTGCNESEKLSSMELAHRVGINLKLIFMKMTLASDLYTGIINKPRSSVKS